MNIRQIVTLYFTHSKSHLLKAELLSTSKGIDEFFIDHRYVSELNFNLSS